jgi:adenylate cyclase
MPVEIERKFLVKGDSWRNRAVGTVIRQGYIAMEAGRLVRVRLAGDSGFLTIKGAAKGLTRPEFEYPIPVFDAVQLISMFCQGRLVEKTRFGVVFNGVEWVVDEFSGANSGLILAEVELESEDQTIELPRWIGQEVSHDRRYSNAYLSIHPYCTWEK